jgi:CheY-like chemotaxis protein
MNPRTFLVVEDDDGVRSLIVTLLKNAGHQAATSTDGADAIARMRRGRFDGLILDLMMPRVNGFEVLDYIAAERPEMRTRTIVITAASAATLGHFDVSAIRTLIHKPFDIHVLLEVINQIATAEEAVAERPQRRALDRPH